MHTKDRIFTTHKEKITHKTLHTKVWQEKVNLLQKIFPCTISKVQILMDLQKKEKQKNGGIGVSPIPKKSMQN